MWLLPTLQRHIVTCSTGTGSTTRFGQFGYRANFHEVQEMLRWPLTSLVAAQEGQNAAVAALYAAASARSPAMLQCCWKLA